MRRALLALILLVSGCLGGADGPSQTPPASGSETSGDLVLYLESGYGLDPRAPTATEPARVAATPFANAFVNEDLRIFESEPSNATMLVTHATFTIYYEVEAPTINPFVNQSDPREGRRLVWWLGSGDVYPTSATVLGDPVLVPGQVYEAQIEFPLPGGGWVVPAHEPFQLFVAPLVVNSPAQNVNFLVDSKDTPSRIELTTEPSELTVPHTSPAVTSTHEIAGNTFLFTGAAPDQVPQTLDIPVEVGVDVAYIETRVVFQGNAGGKSDLDYDLFAPDGRLAGTSGTPFQSEHVRLFLPNLAMHGAGTYTARVTAYSGLTTEFEFQILTNAPR